MVTIIEGISGIVGVPPPLVTARIRAVPAPVPTIYNCNVSFALNERKYSTTKQDSTPTLSLILVLLSGTEVPFTTGKISRAAAAPVVSHWAENNTLYTPVVGITISLFGYVPPLVSIEPIVRSEYVIATGFTVVAV
jgi:hypothetical protein